jgi:multisubunit Na+/H+ antiporter MnhB subunit
MLNYKFKLEQRIKISLKDSKNSFNLSMIFSYKEKKVRKINSNMTIIVMLIVLFLNFANGQNVNFNFDNLNNKSILHL